MIQRTQEKQGVVLSSGGADGAYAVGVLKALFSGKSPVTAYVPLDPVAFVGTSIGAFNSSFMVSHLVDGGEAAADALVRVWLEELAENPRNRSNGAFRYRMDPLALLDPRRALADPLQSLCHVAEDGASLARDFMLRARDFAAWQKPLEQRAIKLLNFSSFVSAEPLLQVIQRNINFANIQRSNVALRIVTTDWAHGKILTFRNDQLTPELGPLLVKASASIPGFFPPVRTGDLVLVDGAVLGYTKLAPAIDAGASTVHVIYVDPDIENIPNDALDSTLDTLYRMSVIGWASRVNQGLEAVDRINRQVEALEKFVATAKISKQDAQALFQAMLPAGRFRQSEGQDGPQIFQVTVHRYHPRDDPFGALGLLNLNRGRIEALIERGFRDAVEHDCTHNKCIVPAVAQQDTGKRL